ncbi:8-amino-7-oxononanoate synthase [Allofranklinella schreckenbergeri]|uniref:8-amino-7-oxononanoate synthase n=1 Tax=Allofranklinella schreckenbergeri TaxID=1076744 RepID=A0A3M6Q8A2_9BURK|nr:8-amino-7-oxononanoate synthase [Allofranklinella schreckenbergeri]RMW98628.1 8-amino-7-oxononanoate synthase [Allofranklinella schreckenbergeri]
MIWNELESALAQRREQGLLRTRRTLQSPAGPQAVVDGQALLSFCSNDYLGLAADARVAAAVAEGAQRWGAGSGASHLVSGHLEPFDQLEERLAAFTGFERALFFSTGYMANLAIVPALVGRGDAVFADRLNHASLIDAVQLSRADHVRYAHNDMAALERLLAQSSARRKLILSDAVFSMDGDLAPLRELLALAERFDAWLVLDDAHGLGVLGPQGRGSLAHLGLAAAPRLILMGTLGKAVGVSGAFVAASTTVIEWLLQTARTYIFTTASSPAVACGVLAALEILAGSDGDARRAHLQRLIAHLRQALADAPRRLLPSHTAIQPLHVGDNHAALALQQHLMQQGLWVPAIRPPTVPAGTARLRISLSAAHTLADVDRLAAALLHASHLLTPPAAETPTPPCN